jgi:hypothetical protein
LSAGDAAQRAALSSKLEQLELQLQLLDLMIRKESAPVPISAAARGDLIDLMARVLVVVFHEEGERVDDRGLVQS